MRKQHIYLFAAAALCASLSSCFKDEPLNAEADIEQAFIHSNDVDGMFYNPSDTLVNVLSTTSNIKFNVRPGTDRTALAPQFRLTEGASITPESGSAHDFSNGPIAYKVTSQDGQWTRDYQVSVVEKQRTVDEVRAFLFDQYALDSEGKYYVWTDSTYDGHTLNCWATGNPGFKLSRGSAKPNEYPTVPVEIDDAGNYTGTHAVQLTTRSTGLFGVMANKRIAAGNLFLGEFDLAKALTYTLEATHFGVPVAKEPNVFKGRYKYTPGDVYQDFDGNAVEGKTDQANMYAVFYKNTDANGNPVMLNGNDVLTNENIVAKAIVTDIKNNGEWAEFSISFEYLQETDPTRLENYGYNIAVVLTSSIEGDKFEGAVGSTLTVDYIRIDWLENIIKE